MNGQTWSCRQLRPMKAAMGAFEQAGMKATWDQQPSCPSQGRLLSLSHLQTSERAPKPLEGCPAGATWDMQIDGALAVFIHLLCLMQAQAGWRSRLIKVQIELKELKLGIT